jgi:hypothetical protein
VGYAGNGNIYVTVSESVVSGSGTGFYALTDTGHSQVQLSLFHSVATNCSGYGLAAEGTGASITAANSMSTTNGGDFSTNNAGVVQSYGDNYFQNNFSLPGNPSLIPKG